MRLLLQPVIYPRNKLLYLYLNVDIWRRFCSNVVWTVLYWYLRILRNICQLWHKLQEQTCVAVFWVMTPRDVIGYHYFGGPCSFHLQGEDGDGMVLHGVITQKIRTWIFITVKIPNLAQEQMFKLCHIGNFLVWSCSIYVSYQLTDIHTSCNNC
jgi:hypothetical protein